MNHITACITPERLRQIAENDLTPREWTELESHLTDCEHCRQVMEEAEAESPWAQEVSDALSGGRHKDGVLSQAIPGVEDSRQGLDSSLQGMLALLGPTDDPRMLGRIGAYEIVGILGRGGMGIVFKGFDAALNRYVAIKMLLPHLATSGAARQRFAREAQAAAAVVNDHVMAIHCVAEWQGMPYLVMPYGRGPSLQKRLSDEGPLSVVEILRIGMQTAKGLAAAHAQGLVHRDVKPANILLDEGVERVALTDFGLARAVDDISLTRVGSLAGTPEFMSPEQARGQSVDAKSDLFSLGCVLYAMCAGRPPFCAESSYGVLRLIIDEEPRSPREINPEVPEWLSAIVAKLMAKRPEDRFASASEVAELLESCLAHLQQPTTVPLPSCLTEPQDRTVRKSLSPLAKVVFVMLAAFGLFLAFIFAWQVFQSAPNKDVALLQGEWQLIASERDGAAQPESQFKPYNERMVIKRSRITQIQIAPDGKEIRGNDGSFSLGENKDGRTIDIKTARGTAHGLYRIDGKTLTLCITRSGGPRPNAFTTTKGDERMLTTYRRTSAGTSNTGLETRTTQTSPREDATTSTRPAITEPRGVRTADETAPLAASIRNLKQIGLALHNYHDVHKAFPPAYTTDNNGKPGLSWRVLILPYVGEAAMYEQFHLDEPWDSEHNKPLLAKIPAVYASPADCDPPGGAAYLGIGGERGVFGRKEGLPIAKITDGLSNTIIVVLSLSHSESVVEWTKPDEFVPDAANPMKGLVQVHSGGSPVLMGDGAVRFLSKETDPEMVRAYLTIDGGESAGTLPLSR